MQEEFAKNSKLIPSQRELRAVLDSPETKRLLELLRADGGTALQNAAKAVRQGDAEAARRLLSPLLEDPEAEALMDRIGRKL